MVNCLYTLVIYDISNNELRQKVANACKSFGLSRIQKSAFMGLIPSSIRKELIARLEALAKEEETSNIQVFVICNPDMALKIELGKPYEGEGEEFIV